MKKNITLDYIKTTIEAEPTCKTIDEVAAELWESREVHALGTRVDCYRLIAMLLADEIRGIRNDRKRAKKRNK